MLTVKKGEKLQFDIYLDKEADLVDQSILPQVVVYYKDDVLLLPENMEPGNTVERVDEGHYTAEFYADPDFEIGNEYRIEWLFTLFGEKFPTEKRRQRFEIVDRDYPKFTIYEEEPYKYIIQTVRDLILDRTTPIKAFTIISTRSEYVKISHNSLKAFLVDNSVKEFLFKDYSTVYDLLSKVEEDVDWEIVIDVECDSSKSPYDLQPTLKTFIGAEEMFYFTHFFSDIELRNIIDTSIATFNRDFYVDYDISNFPKNQVDLLQYLISNKALLIRSVRDAKSLSDLIQEDRIKEVTLGGKLNVKFQMPDQLEKNSAMANPIDSWRKLAGEYYKLYKNQVDKIPIPIKKGKISPTTLYDRKHYNIDPGINKDINLHYQILDDALYVEWDIINERDFGRYDLYLVDNIEDTKRNNYVKLKPTYTTINKENNCVQIPIKEGKYFLFLSVANRNLIKRQSKIKMIEYYRN